jgi:PAS domain S-box-containing protein
MGVSLQEREKESARIGLLAALLGGLFLFDIITPLGFANHFLYATCILVASGSSIPWLPWATAGTASALTAIGIFYSQPWPGLPLWIPVANRLFTITVLCVLAWFAVKRRQAETALVRVNEGLEEKVSERTKELAGVNEALVSEITERMEAEQALRISQGRLAGILNIAEDAIIVIDHHRSIVLFNRGAVKLFGYGAEEVLGGPLDLLLPERHRGDDPARPSFAATEDPNHLPHRLELCGLRKDGTEFPAEATISPLTVGNMTTFTIILRDITDRLRTERQLQSLTTQLMTAQEEERRRISRELHDDINQRLALLAIELGRLEAHPPATPEKARPAFQALTQRLAAISDDVRRMAYQFHPSILDDLGLSAALKYLADDFSSKTGIKTIVVQEELDEPLPRDIASCLYRIAQESLANVTKHAKTSRVELELTCDEQAVTLSIHDAGVGFDVERVQAQHAGLGLVNMRERVRSVRGRLDIQSQPGEGTHIIVNIPLPGAPYESSTSPVSR